MESFSTIKVIPGRYPWCKFKDITNYAIEDPSLFSFCRTEEEVDALIKCKYSHMWNLTDIFEHIIKIIKKPVDEILIKFVPLITRWHHKYNAAAFCGNNMYGEYIDIFKIAVILNSTRLLEKIIESSGENKKPNATDLMLACKMAHDDIILLLIKNLEEHKNMQIDGKTPLNTYIMNGQNKQVVQILATKENIFYNDNVARIVNQFGPLFLADLIRDLYADTTQQHKIGNLVDIDGNFVQKDPAESAIAIFGDGNVLQRDEVKKVFIQPGKLMMTDIYGKKICKEFINGIHIEIPISPMNGHKIRYHKLAINDNGMLVRFDKFRW